MKHNYVARIAAEVLEAFGRVSSVAKETLRRPQTQPSDVFASINSLNSAEAVKQLTSVFQSNREALEILSREPAVARVVAEDDNGELDIIYICRAAPIQVIHKFASYRAQLGRLASLKIGGSLSVPSGKRYTLVEKALLHPIELKEGWDSENTILSSETIRTLTIESLRAALGIREEIQQEDLVSQLLADEQIQINLIDGIRRRVITKMGLRDQPVLDQFQDEIFRLPLNKQLLILGPPGTGKTTTLIRRLGQKLDQEFLDDDEKQLIAAISRTTSTPHSASWLMFTPTQLLKQYLKEAFAKEGIAASDERIKTWHDLRHDLARNVFGVLRTASGTGALVMKNSLLSITQAAIVESIRWFEDFDGWQRSVYLDRLTASATALSADHDAQIAKLGSRLLSLTQVARRDGIALTLEALSHTVEAARGMASQRKQSSDSILNAELNRRLNQNHEFLDELFGFITDLRVSEDDDDEDFQTEEEEDAPRSKSPRAVALGTYRSAIKALARSSVSRRTLKRESMSSKIIAWLGPRIMNADQLRELGTNLTLESHLRVFVNPVRRYLDGMQGRYRAFRRIRREAKSWYTDADIASNDVHPLEVDVVLLAILKSSRELLSRADIAREIGSAVWSPLNSSADQYRTQILVDEATDFSPVQLQCMYALSNPRTSSFFACGDFNQRLTNWGTRTSDEMHWVCSEMLTRQVNIIYRQSRQLNDLSSAIIDLTGGTKPQVNLPADVDSEGVAPALIENAGVGIAGKIEWLARRILEIESFVRQLPSIAVFVPSEADVQPFAASLNGSLIDHNLRVVPCPNGQVVGQQNEIRVFDVQHIKGLEFEAVFFVDLDRLAAETNDLFPRYLYVGSTRAATYLGITCERFFPSVLKPIQPMFVSEWKQ